MKFYILLLFTLSLSHLIGQTNDAPEIIRGDERFSMMIKTVDNNSGARIIGTEVYLYETKSGLLVDDKRTDKDGLVRFLIDPLKEYEVRTCHPYFLKNGLSIFECNDGNEVICAFGGSDYKFTAYGGPDKPNAIFGATLNLQPFKTGSVFELENVYYDLDKATLRPESKSELKVLAKIMKRNKSIVIELSSHTDSRASTEYNDALSKERALSCYDYLIRAGIDSKRITPVGYGESILVNNCDDNVICSEEAHQRNRRTEVKVLYFEPITCEPSLEKDFELKELKFDSEE